MAQMPSLSIWRTTIDDRTADRDKTTGDASGRAVARGNPAGAHKTVVSLRRAHHWFWTTLVEADSFGVRERLQWKNDDTLDVTLGFGCLAHMTRPIEAVGSIHISYDFSDGDKTLSKSCRD
jgi:hypothetical protein